MPGRSLPNTDVQRSTALDTVFNKAAATAAAQRPFTTDQYNALVAQRAPWKTAVGGAAACLSLQIQAVNAAETQGQNLEQHVSHFFQVFNLGVARGKFAASDRAFYQLDASDGAAPALTSHADRLTWAQNIVAGEAARQTAAGPAYVAMAMPAAAEIGAAQTAYLNSLEPASTAKDNYEAAQVNVQNLRPAVDAVIVDLWDSIEFAFRHDDPPTLRRKAREWGVVYAPRPGETPDPTPTPTPTPPAT
jgi:hypothetical protein